MDHQVDQRGRQQGHQQEHRQERPPGHHQLGHHQLERQQVQVLVFGISLLVALQLPMRPARRYR